MSVIQQTPQNVLDKWCRTNDGRPKPVSLEVFLAGQEKKPAPDCGRGGE